MVWINFYRKLQREHLICVKILLLAPSFFLFPSACCFKTPGSKLQFLARVLSLRCCRYKTHPTWFIAIPKSWIHTCIQQRHKLCTYGKDPTFPTLRSDFSDWQRQWPQAMIEMGKVNPRYLDCQDIVNRPCWIGYEICRLNPPVVASPLAG